MPKSALLLIDIQNAMFGPDEICHQPERMLANAADLLARARAATAPIYFVQHCEDGGPFTPKAEGWQIHPKVAPKAGEPVIEKWARDAHSTFDTPLLPADKIIAHHNRLLSGIVERVVTVAEIKF